MGSLSVDYKAVISDLEQKRSQMNNRFDAAIAAIRQVLALEGSAEQLRLPTVALPKTASNGPYRGLTMPEAAIKHLRTAGGPIGNVALAKALEDGGFEHKSRNFPNTLNSVLRRRHLSVGDIRKSSKGWELAQGQ